MSFKRLFIAVTIIICLVFACMLGSNIVKRFHSWTTRSDMEIALDNGGVYTGLLKDVPCNCVAKKVRDIPGTSIQEVSVLKKDELKYYSIVSGLAAKSDSIKVGDSVYLVDAEYRKQGLIGMRSETEAMERPGEEMYSLLVRKK